MKRRNAITYCPEFQSITTENESLATQLDAFLQRWFGMRLVPVVPGVHDVVGHDDQDLEPAIFEFWWSRRESFAYRRLEW